MKIKKKKPNNKKNYNAVDEPQVNCNLFEIIFLDIYCNFRSWATYIMSQTLHTQKRRKNR